MYYYPSDALEKIEFDKIQLQISAYCKSEMGVAMVSAMQPMHDYKSITTELNRTNAFLSILLKNVSIPVSSFENITNDIKLLGKDGFILDAESVLRIQKVLIISESLKQFFTSNEVVEIEGIREFAYRLQDTSLILKRIDQVYNHEGELRPNASPELLKITKMINSKNRELDKVFGSIASDFKKKDLLTDNVESYRNGRRVLSVPVENKRKIRGIIHDESSTGKTTFIEPEAVIDINNQLFDLDTDKRKEVFRILRALCDDIRPYTNEIIDNYKQLIYVDFVAAKAKFARQVYASLPEIVDRPIFALKEARHPYLLIKNEQEGKKTIAFDLDLRAPNKILLLSGPNAGGKSVTMKAVGLIQSMVQSGVLPTVDENSKIGVFKKILCDIGDQQSLDDDLSTYSSRLTNMVKFMADADRDTLILIDEFGSGTDPQIGGAIAEAILKDLNHKKVYGVITTHYSNLKYFAYKTRGIVNGGMLFDKESLGPSYEMKIGKPGSSFAFEIAEKTGLPKSVLKYARYKTGKNEKAIDQLLTDLQSEKQVLEEKLGAIASKEEDLDRLTKTYNQLQKDLEFRRKRLKLDIKEQQIAAANKTNHEMNKLLKEMKSAEDVKKAREVVKKQKEKTSKTQEKIQTLKKEVFYREEFTIKDFKVGAYAKMREAGTTGQILSIYKDVAELAVGSFTMKVPISGLVPTATPIDRKNHKNVNTQITKMPNFESKIDIRGYTKSDGIDFVQELVEQAMMRNVDMLTILHGKGSGALRNAVHKKLKEYKVSKVWHPQDEFGGDGVTYVRL